MQADAVSDQLRCEEIAFHGLSDHKHGGDDGDGDPAVELRQGQSQREHQADHRSDVGNERQEARDEADHQAEVEPGQGQADGIEYRQRQADRALAAQETGQSLVHLLRQPADRLLMAARQPVVDLGDHVVPIAQQVERHHRCDHHQRDEIEESDAAGDNPPQNLRGPGEDLVGRAAEYRFHFLLRARIQAVAQQFDDGGDLALDGRQVVRRAVDQGRDLADHRRDHQQQHQYAGQDKAGGDDRGCPGSRQLPLLQLVADRIEEIGHGHAGNEWQQDTAEQKDADQDNDQQDQPEPDLADHGNAGAGLTLGRFRLSGIRLAHCRAGAGKTEPLSDAGG